MGVEGIRISVLCAPDCTVGTPTHATLRFYRHGKQYPCQFEEILAHRYGLEFRFNLYSSFLLIGI